MSFTETAPDEQPEMFSSGKDATVLRYLFRNFSPKRHLEFGTWKGEGVKRVLEECDASVWTVNLWEGESSDSGAWAYGRSDARSMIGTHYLEAGLGYRVNQIYADSRLWADEAYPDGFFDSAFVDGGHDAATARSDLYKSLRLLRPGGLLLVHDFCPLPEINAQHPSTVGVTRMAVDEWERIRAMCDEVFWIEDTWLLCGIRKKNPTEEEKARERIWFAEAGRKGRIAVERKITVQDAPPRMQTLFLYEAGRHSLEYNDIAINQDVSLTPGGNSPHLATPYFWLPGRSQGVLTLTLDVRFAENSGTALYRCTVQDAEMCPLAECSLDAGARHQRRQLRIAGAPEAPSRLTFTPVTQESCAPPVAIRVDCDAVSTAVTLFQEFNILKSDHKELELHLEESNARLTEMTARCACLLNSRWRKLGRRLGIVKSLPFE